MSEDQSADGRTLAPTIVQDSGWGWRVLALLLRAAGRTVPHGRRNDSASANGRRHIGSRSACHTAPTRHRRSEGQEGIDLQQLGV